MTTSPPHARGGRNLLRQMWFWALLGVLLGIIAGLVAPAFAVGLQPLGTLFIALMKMIIAPVVFCAMISGVRAVDRLGSVGRIGLRALVYFFSATAVLMLVGLAAGHLFHPGAGMNVNPAELDTSSLTDKIGKQGETGWDYVLSVVPTTLFSAFTGGNILATLLVSLLVGIALKVVGEPAEGVFTAVEAFSAVVNRIVKWLLWLAPVGAFGAIAYTVGKFGGAKLANLGLLILSYSLVCLVVIVVLFGLVSALAGVNLAKLVRYLRTEVVLGLATTSGESVMPGLIEKLEALGIRPPVVRLVIPAGYSFNLDGAAIYLTMVITFLADATGTPLSFATEIGMCTVLLLLSKGSAGFGGGVLIVLASTMGGIVPIPVAALALVVGIDRLMNEARTTTTIIGNAVATIVIARWEGALDRERARFVLDGHAPAVTGQDPGRVYSPLAGQPVDHGTSTAERTP